MILVKNKERLQNRLYEAIEKGVDSDNKWVYVKITNSKGDTIEKIYGPFEEQEAYDMTDGLEKEGYYEYEILDDDAMSQRDLDNTDVYSFPGEDDELVEPELDEAKKKETNYKLPKRIPINRTIDDTNWWNHTFDKASQPSGEVATADGAVGAVAVAESVEEDFFGLCPYCHSGNVDVVDCDDDSCKMICRDCGEDYIEYEDGSITDRHGRKIEVKEDFLPKDEIKEAVDTNKAEQVKALDRDSFDSFDDYYEEVYNILVPQSGRADTLAGELLRAVNKIMYNYYRNDEYFYFGVGKEEVGDAAKFLYAKTEGSEVAKILVDIVKRAEIEDNYEESILELQKAIINYVVDEKPETLSTENKENMNDGADVDFDSYIKTDTLYVDVPEGIQKYLKRGDVTDSDIINDIFYYGNFDLVEDLGNVNAEISYDNTELVVYDVPLMVFDKVESELIRALDDEELALENDFADNEEEEEEEYDEE